jgi:hypothetical protein
MYINSSAMATGSTLPTRTAHPLAVSLMGWIQKTNFGLDRIGSVAGFPVELGSFNSFKKKQSARYFSRNRISRASRTLL